MVDKLGDLTAASRAALKVVMSAAKRAVTTAVEME